MNIRKSSKVMSIWTSLGCVSYWICGMFQCYVCSLPFLQWSWFSGKWPNCKQKDCFGGTCFPPNHDYWREINFQILRILEDIIHSQPGNQRIQNSLHLFFRENSSPPWKLTWQRKITIFDSRYIDSFMVGFPACHVSFAGVEIHGATGFLVRGFSSPIASPRSRRWNVGCFERKGQYRWVIIYVNILENIISISVYIYSF